MFSQEKFPAALFLDSGSDRYDASECKANIMSLAENLTPAFGCVAQYSRNCFTYFSRFSVPLDCRDAMEVVVTAIVGSNALEYHAKLPNMSCMRLIRSGDMDGEVYFSSICIFEPYWIVTVFAGVCCGRLCLVCWYLCRALGTKLGMWVSRVRLSYFHLSLMPTNNSPFQSTVMS